MINAVITDACEMDAISFNIFRSQVPSERQTRSDRYDRLTDRYTSITVFSLLQKLWTEQRAGPLPPITIGRFGKPDFTPGTGLHFNWSHDGSLCACLLGPVPVGVDISGRVPFEESLFDYMAAPGEKSLKELLRNKDDLSLLWTRKEAIIKRTGRGLTTPLEQVNTMISGDIVTFTCDALGFQLSLSAEGMREDELHEELRVRFVTPGPAGVWQDSPSPGLRRLGTNLEAYSWDARNSKIPCRSPVASSCG